MRTACNASGDESMMNAYRAFDYQKQFQNSIELYSYERLNTLNEGYKTLYMMTKDDILLDNEGNQIRILSKEDEGDKFRLTLADNNLHTFIVNKPGQDLYSLIASKIYKNRYEDNLEFYPAGTKITYEGKEIVCGDDKEHLEEITNGSFSVPYFRLVETLDGYKEANQLKLQDILVTDVGNVNIINIKKENDLLNIKVQLI